MSAMQFVIAQNDWLQNVTYVWLDWASVPQKNPVLQSLAIDSLPLYAALADAFAVVAPPAVHAQTREPCSSATYEQVLGRSSGPCTHTAHGACAPPSVLSPLLNSYSTPGQRPRATSTAPDAYSGAVPTAHVVPRRAALVLSEEWRDEFLDPD